MNNSMSPRDPHSPIFEATNVISNNWVDRNTREIPILIDIFTLQQYEIMFGLLV